MSKPEASAEVLQQRLDELREIVRDRPDGSVYVDVRNGKARLVFPDGGMIEVREGEAVRVWPNYIVRREGRAR